MGQQERVSHQVLGDRGRGVWAAQGPAKRIHPGGQERTENEIGENRTSGVWPSC